MEKPAHFPPRPPMRPYRFLLKLLRVQGGWAGCGDTTCRGHTRGSVRLCWAEQQRHDSGVNLGQ